MEPAIGTSAALGFWTLLHSEQTSWSHGSDLRFSFIEKSQRSCLFLSLAPHYSFSPSLTPTPDTSVLTLKGGITSGSPSSSPRRTPHSWHVQCHFCSSLGADSSLWRGFAPSSERPQPAAGPLPALPSLAPHCLTGALVPLPWLAAQAAAGTPRWPHCPVAAGWNRGEGLPLVTGQRGQSSHSPWSRGLVPPLGGKK